MEKEAITKMYDLRRDLIIIGLTGRTGSGCSTVANLLSQTTFDACAFPQPIRSNQLQNDERKEVIVYDFLKQNWHPFTVINVSDIITSFLVEKDFNDILAFFKAEFNSSIPESNIEQEINSLKILINEVKAEIPTWKVDWVNLIESESLKKLTHQIKTVTNKYRNVHKASVYQVLGTNLRSSGCAICSDFGEFYTFIIAERINDVLIQLIASKKRYIVIDSIRNSLEASYLKEKYVSFYLFAINTEDIYRIKRLNNKLTKEEIEQIDKLEYQDKKEGLEKFRSQDIKGCIQNAEIYVHNPTDELPNDPQTTLKKQLVRYIALIYNPGIITPSPVERCMQIAYTAKYNSGCISRQVGAVITNNKFSVKALGWNNTPEGQVPCLLRSYDDYLNYDHYAFSNYELSNEFRQKVSDKFVKQDPINLKGKKLCFCFKDVNELKGNKNQVLTRSLHAEENAFLQISKYGGTGIDGGFLFTTASPCELCSKKAYQLNIKRIYYIEPYPGIAGEHIINSGPEESKPHLKLFHGAIGWAYHQLYQPFIPYKDELKMIYSPTEKE